MKLGIRSKLFALSIGLILISILVFYAYTRARLERAVTESIGDDLVVRANLVALRAGTSAAPPGDYERWDRLADSLGASAHARVTFIDHEGAVLGDSDVKLEDLPGLENHRLRPEVHEAFAGRIGRVRRYSSTVERGMLYVAVPMQAEKSPVAVARVALPLTEVDQTLGALRGVLGVAVALALIMAVLMSSFAAHLASRTVRRLTDAARQMARGDLGIRTRVEGRDEYGELGRALDSLAQSLSQSLSEVSRERDRLSGILAGMQDGVLLVDREDRVQLQNPALSEMRLVSADAIDKPVEETVLDQRLKSLLSRARRASEPVTSELEVSGLQPRLLVVRAARLESEDGGLFAVFVDVTNTRRLETMRRDFVANVSHELRTPVTAIRSAAETLLMSGLSDAKAANNFLAMIERNAERLQELVEDLLDLSRIESQKYQLNYEELDLEEVFGHAVSLLGERAERQKVKLVYEVEPGLSAVLADRRALEHVLTNLIDNAIKYGGEGATVTLRASQSTEWVRVVVRDTGPGIEAAHLPRLFERFYRVDSSRSRELGGTGLGLSIVKHLVDSMGGSVGVESEIGKGTAFTLVLRRPGVEGAAE